MVSISIEILEYHALQHRLMANVRMTPRQKFKKAVEILAVECPKSKIDPVWSNRKQVYKALNNAGWHWEAGRRLGYWSGIPF